MANASITIKLTPTEYRTFLDALTMYDDILGRLASGDKVVLEPAVDNDNLLVQQGRTQALLEKVGAN